MQEKHWTNVPEFEKLYELNKAGDIRSLHPRNFHKIIKPRIDRGGYYAVRLSKGGHTFTRFVHRLLAIAFIPNTDKRKHINHKNGNKLDNSLGNLEWCTPSENIKHAYDMRLVKKQKPSCMQVIDICTNQVYTSVSEAARGLGIPYSTCKNYLNGNRTNQTCLRYAA